MRKTKISNKKVQKSKRGTVLKLLGRYKKKFKLGHIKFKVMFVRGKKVKEYYAEVLMRTNRVRIKFNEDLMEQRPQEIQDTVIHELLHVLFYKLMNKMLVLTVNHVRGEEAQKKHEERFCCLEHEIIERLVPVLIDKK